MRGLPHIQARHFNRAASASPSASARRIGFRDHHPANPGSGKRDPAAALAAKAAKAAHVPASHPPPPPNPAPSSAHTSAVGPRVGHAVRSDDAGGSIAISIMLDGIGRVVGGGTGDDFMDHMLALFAAHGRFDIVASRDTAPKAPLTLAEAADLSGAIGEVLGVALNTAVGTTRCERRRLRRIGSASATHAEAFVHVSLELVTHGSSYLGSNDVRDPPLSVCALRDDASAAFDVTPLAYRLYSALCYDARLSLHLMTISGTNSNNVASATIKAIALALREAVTEA